MVGYAARFLPLALLLAHEAMARLDAHWLEAAQNLGASPRSGARTILWPLLRGARGGVFAVVTSLCAAELTTTVLVNAPGGQTMPLPIFNQMHIGATAEVAALSLTLCCITAVAALAALISTTRKYGRK
jgi:ABC-type Fe3+ transport system permease subunit